MFFTESIYFLIIFTLPAAIHLIYHAYIRFSPRIQKDKSLELAESITFCISVFVICVLFFGNKMKDFAQYILLSANEKETYITSNPNFNYLDFLVLYTCVTFLVSIITIAIWYGIIKRLFHILINIFNKTCKKSQELKFPDIWRNLFETDDLIKRFECCIVIEKSNNVITAGLLHSYPPPHLDSKELLLYHTEQIKEIVKEDILKSPNDRIFYPALYEYYDVNADILMKFYDIDKLKRIWYPQTKS